MRLGDADGSPREDREPDDPIDLAALRADDTLVEALAAGRVRLDDGATADPGPDTALVAMLAAWVADVRPETLAEPTPPEPAAEPVPIPAPTPAASGRRTGSPSYARRAAIAATLVVIAFSSLAVGTSKATPGAPLWEISKVFDAERARSVEAAASVTTCLQAARTALREGDRDEAARSIADAERHLGAVRPDEGRVELAREKELLKVLATPEGPQATAEPGTGSAPPTPSTGDALLPAPPAASPTGTTTDAPAPGAPAPGTRVPQPTSDTPPTATDPAAAPPPPPSRAIDSTTGPAPNDPPRPSGPNRSTDPTQPGPARPDPTRPDTPGGGSSTPSPAPTPPEPTPVQPVPVAPSAPPQPASSTGPTEASAAPTGSTAADPAGPSPAADPAPSSSPDSSTGR